MKITLEIPKKWENDVDAYLETLIDEVEADLMFHPFRGHSRVDFLKMLRRSFKRGEKICE